MRTQSQLDFLTQTLGQAAFSHVALAKRHREATTAQAIDSVKNELETKCEYRQDVLGKSKQLLTIETRNNEEARSVMSIRRRKVDRARRKLERLKSENRSVKHEIESQATKLKNQELEKDTIMNLFCLMRIKDCL
jgi:hypothetical protein